MLAVGALLVALASPAAATYIFAGGNPDACLTLDSNYSWSGAKVSVVRCDGRWQQKWKIHRGSGHVVMANGNQVHCLDAGSNPGNGIHMKIWDCYDGLPAQQWYYTDDNRIAVEGKGQCLDVPNGDITDHNPIQTWQCATGNTNQVWTSGEHYATEGEKVGRTIRYSQDK